MRSIQGDFATSRCPFSINDSTDNSVSLFNIKMAMNLFPTVLDSRFAASDWAAHFYPVQTENGHEQTRGERPLIESELKVCRSVAAEVLEQESSAAPHADVWADWPELDIGLPCPIDGVDMAAPSVSDTFEHASSVFDGLVQAATAWEPMNTSWSSEIYAARLKAKADGKASNSVGVKESWSDTAIHRARMTRHDVEVMNLATAEVTEHKSVREAFRALRLPDSKHIRFRGALKASAIGEAEFSYDGRTFLFVLRRDTTSQ